MPISALYDDIPLLLLPPDLDASATARTFSLDMDEFEGDAGGGLGVTHSTLPNAKEQIAFLCKTRDELNELELFIRALDGRARPFWLPTWNDDLDVLVGGGSNIIITDIDYYTRLFPIVAMRTIFWVSQSDTSSWGIRTIYDVDQLPANQEQLFGAQNAGTAIDFATSKTHRFMFLRFVRLESDDVVIEHLDGEKAIVTLSVENIPASYPPWNTIGVTEFRLSGGDWGDGTYISTPEPGGIPGDGRREKTLMGDVTVPADANQPPPYASAYISPVAEVGWVSVPLAETVSLIAGPAQVFIRFTTGSAQNNWQWNGFQARMWVERGGVDVYGPFLSNWGNGWISIGSVTLTFPYVEFMLADGDQIRIELYGHLLLASGSDGGGRPWVNWGAGGGPYWSLAYFPGTIQAL
jgi:hypothetical protein